MTIKESLLKSFDKKWCLRINTKHPDGDFIKGVVLDIKSGFVVILRELDFEFEELIIFPKKYIKSIRDGKLEATCNQIIRHNGQFKKIKVPKWLERCQTLEEVLLHCHMKDVWPVVETLFNKGKDNALYIGPIMGTGPVDFGLKCYDAQGKWEKVYTLDYAEIFKIEIGDRYSKHFNAFMRSKSRKKT